MDVLLQTNWLIDPVPRTLPIWLLSLGLEAMFLGIVVQAMRESGVLSQLTSRERLVGVLGTGAGYFFLSLSVIRTSYGAYAAFLFVLFRTLEGAAAVQIYARILAFLQDGSLPGDFKAKFRHYLVTFFIIALGSYLVLHVLIRGPFLRGFWYDLSLVYTVTSATLAYVSVRWRLRDVQSDINGAVIAGIAVCIAGAQIYGFSLTEDVLLSVVGGVVYAIGFWSAAWFLFGDRLLGSDPNTCSNCDFDHSSYTSPSYCPNCGVEL
jgi:hypothetical protein